MNGHALSDAPAAAIVNSARDLVAMSLECALRHFGAVKLLYDRKSDDQREEIDGLIQQLLDSKANVGNAYIAMMILEVLQSEKTGRNDLWLATSGIRHNSKCAWFKRKRGRHCQPDEGRACNNCGG